MLQDIAVLTGGKVITEEIGLKLADATLEDLGRAHKVTATKENTTIVNGQGDKQAVEDRALQLTHVMNGKLEEEKKLNSLLSIFS